MSTFFRKETKNRILVGVTTGVLVASSLIGVTPAFAEDTPSNPAASAAMVSTVTAGAPAPVTPSATSTTPETPATGDATADESNFTFEQGNIPPVAQNVPANRYAAQFVSDASLQGYKFVGDFDDTALPPNDITDPDGNYVAKWVSDDGDKLTPGGPVSLEYINGATYHAVWQNKDNGNDVQYRLVVDANGGHFEGGVTTLLNRQDFLPANMHNVAAAGQITRDGYTLVGFSANKNATTASSDTLTQAMSIRDAEHTPGHTTEGALPGKTDEVYTVYAIWRSNSAAPATPSNPIAPSTPSTPSTNTTQPADTTQSTTTTDATKPADKPSKTVTHEKSSRKHALPNTGDATVVSAGLLSSIGSVFALLGLKRKRK